MSISTLVKYRENSRLTSLLTMVSIIKTIVWVQNKFENASSLYR